MWQKRVSLVVRDRRFDRAKLRAPASGRAAARVEPRPTETHRKRPATNGAVDEAILAELKPSGDRPQVVYRGSGDSYLLVEYGPIVLDLNLRFRVHALMQWVDNHQVPGVVDLTPGIRSLQVHFAPG